MKSNEEDKKRMLGADRSDQTEDGLELPDSQSKFVPIGPRRLSLAEQIKRVLRTEVERFKLHAELETPEEALDFDVDDESPLPLSGFESQELQQEFYNDPALVAEVERLEQALAKAEVARPPEEPVVPEDIRPDIEKDQLPLIE